MFQIKETYAVDNFAVFGITVCSRNLVIFVYASDGWLLSLSFKPGVALHCLFFPKLLHSSLYKSNGETTNASFNLSKA